MISSLNTIINKIIKLIKSVLSNINNIYSSLINWSELNSILNDIKNKNKI
jgi:hypothetical protein